MKARARIADFHSAILYEDLGSGLNARELLEGVFAAAGFAGGHRLTMWKMNLLSLPEMRAVIEADLATATLLCLAVGPQQSLPAGMAALVKGWLRSGEWHGGALIVLLEGDQETEAGNRICSQFRTAADQANIAYFCRRQPAPVGERLYDPLQMLSPTGTDPGSSTCCLRRHWGINE